MLNKLKKVSFIFLLIFLIAIVTGITYAAYLITLNSSENIVTTGLVSMSYTESTNVISIENALPMSYADGKTSDNYFDFSITSNLTLNKNDPNTNVYYSIELEPLSVDDGYNQLSDNQIELYLEDITNNKVLIDSKSISKLSNYLLYNTSHTHKYGVNSITTKYRLRAWINYYTDASSWNSSNKYEYKFRVNVNGDMDAISNSLYTKIANNVKTSNISYKYINDANMTENDITYNVDDNGVFLYNGIDESEGKYPIYYYRGNVTNNNVLFGGFCWKIVRTTSTGGTKLIYNGIPTDGTCNNTGESSTIGTSKFNNFHNSPAASGYMYGDIYKYTKKDMSNVTDTYMYGNDVEYDETTGLYTLIGKTKISSSWSKDKTTLAYGYHYTCLNETGICEEVYYVYDFIDSVYTFYFTFTNGDNLDSAKEKMNTNTNDSAIKIKIDDWYKNNLTEYTEYIENTIFCNERVFNNSSGKAHAYIIINGKNVPGYYPIENKDGFLSNSALSYSYYFSNYKIKSGSFLLECSNSNDKFSLNKENGGTDGFGNNTLRYPVGLLTIDEAMLAGGQSSENTNYYLYTGNDTWLATPYVWYNASASISYLSSTGKIGNSAAVHIFGVRPVISLKHNIEVQDGNGSSNSPYVVL